MSAKAPFAVLFDCDGVLVNSEELAAGEYKFLGARYGLHYTAAEFQQISTGVAYEAYIARLDADHRRVHGRGLPPDFEKVIAQRYHDMMEKHLRQIPHIAPLLQSLRDHGVPYALCTNAQQQGTQWKLRHVGLSAYFNRHVYSKDMVANPKPAPDIYLLGARRLGYAPRDCFVVEDSTVGARAGIAAGARVIGYAGGSHRAAGYHRELAAAGAEFTAYCMKDVQAYLLRRLRGPQPPVTPPAPAV